MQPAKVEEIAQGIRRREADLRGALRNDTLNNQPARPAPQAAPPAPAPAPTPAPGTPPAPGAQAPQGQEGDPATAAAADQFDYQLARALDLIRGVSLFNTRAAN